MLDSLLNTFFLGSEILILKTYLYFWASKKNLTYSVLMIYKVLPLALMMLNLINPMSHITTDPKPLLASHKVAATSLAKSVFENLSSPKGFMLPEFQAFSKAIEGYELLKAEGKIEKEILTIVDFSLSANAKRMWIIDMTSYTILHHVLVAHGRNTGDEFAAKFSNTPESFQSSLGFYATAETYHGKHGLSLRLDGLEQGINDKARARAIVIHGADYVSEEFIEKHGRLGRSQGCPALPVELTEEIITLIKEKSCLFIYHPSRSYAVKSKLIS